MTDGSPSSAAEVCTRHGDDPSALIEILHDLQEEQGAVREPDLHAIADRLNLTRAEVHGVMSFYHDFRRKPAGAVVVKVCRAEACQSMGAGSAIEKLLQSRNMKMGETSADGVTVEPVYCLGNCALAPAIMVNERLVGRATGERMEQAIAEAAR